MLFIPQKAQTEDSTTFDPDKFFETWGDEQLQPLYAQDFRRFICKAFGLKPSDTYIYKAIAEVTILQAQTYIEFGGQGRLHEWYRDAEGTQRPAPPAIDVAAYTNIFAPTTVTLKALTGLASNAKKGSIRADVAKHLQSLYQPPSAERKIVVPRSKTHVNPYFDVWAWSNQNLEWAGPEEGTSKITISHAILPVLYHHFACVCPSYESLEIIRQVCKGRTIIDLGSGNGYWTYMLRQLDKKKPLHVIPIDSGLSEWRTVWIGDTTQKEGVQWLQSQDGGRNMMLLLVYPQVGLEFASKVLKAYKGDTIVAASTQNANGFTAFENETIADYVAREMTDWEKILQIPLPSFAGKDEALFVFERKSSITSL